MALQLDLSLSKDIILAKVKQTLANNPDASVAEFIQFCSTNSEMEQLKDHPVRELFWEDGVETSKKTDVVHRVRLSKEALESLRNTMLSVIPDGKTNAMSKTEILATVPNPQDREHLTSRWNKMTSELKGEGIINSVGELASAKWYKPHK